MNEKQEEGMHRASCVCSPRPSWGTLRLVDLGGEFSAKPLEAGPTIFVIITIVHYGGQWQRRDLTEDNRVKLGSCSRWAGWGLAAALESSRFCFCFSLIVDSSPEGPMPAKAG